MQEEGILWMGDIPCFFVGKKGVLSIDQFEGEDKRWYLNTAFTTILGVLPVISTSLKPVKINKEGQKLGLSYVWSGIRPIIKDK
jgi:hypothetical protein